MLYLMRHGETDWNRERRIQGHSDIPLNETGVKTMTEAGKRLKAQGFQVDRIVSSPLKRAKETAGLIAEQIGYPGEIPCDDGLIERGFGLAEGISLLDHPDLSDESYGVEPMAALLERAEKVLRKYRSDAEHDWLLVTHGAFIMAAMELLSGQSQGEGYLSLPAQGNPIRVTEKNGSVTWEYVLPMQYKTEPHLHTFPVSSCAHMGPEEIVRRYREAGYDTLIISDHFAKFHYDKLEAHLGETFTWQRYVELFFTGYEAAKAAGDELGIRVLCSAELTLDGNHYLLYGADKAFFLSLPRLFDMTIEEFYPIAKDRGVTVIQAHPLRNGKCTPHPAHVDGFEVFNTHPRQQDFNEEAQAMAEHYPHLLQTAGSDAHRVEDIAGTAVLSETPVETVEDYLALLRSGKATFLNWRGNKT